MYTVNDGWYHYVLHVLGPLCCALYEAHAWPSQEHLLVKVWAIRRVHWVTMPVRMMVTSRLLQGVVRVVQVALALVLHQRAL